MRTLLFVCTILGLLALGLVASAEELREETREKAGRMVGFRGISLPEPPSLSESSSLSQSPSPSLSPRPPFCRFVPKFNYDARRLLTRRGCDVPGSALALVDLAANTKTESPACVGSIHYYNMVNGERQILSVVNYRDNGEVQICCQALSPNTVDCSMFIVVPSSTTTRSLTATITPTRTPSPATRVVRPI
eukprot:TRINITY_DN21969_c0_g1_i1.p1 TRINITY_DN21969_c0_g1~~TRINITY_DN21969_c0_g1_i1.p1  ORF type:complete len:191 (+),score=15.86 TRINITY_DN21969_c0_g1_i1:31-603(+)